MSTEHREGDLFGTRLPAIAQGCNCDGMMGAGIAAEFRRHWPYMYSTYRWLCQSGQFQLGSVMSWQTQWQSQDITIYNLATQQHGGPCAEPWAIGSAVYRMIGLAEQAGIPEIGLPRIGCGIGGLDWDTIRAILDAAGLATKVRLIVFEYRRPG